MATMEQAASENALLRLWRDKQARAVIIQIVTLAAIFAFFFYIIRNAAINLDAIGKGLSFEFLSAPASYDINQSLIEYDSRSSHFTAMIVGILNTLMVAIAGIVLATILGFILGVFRLSRNVLINKIAYCYIEVVRNVPVLLWILLVHGFVVNVLPVPKVAAGGGWDIAGIAFLSNRGFYMPDPNFTSAAWLVLAAFIAGVVFSIGYGRRAKKLQEETGKILPVFLVSMGAIVLFPVVVFLVLGLPVEFSYPELKGFNFQGGFVIKPEFMALWLALSMYTSSFIAEIVRSGIESVSHGQTEAAHALGVSHGRTLQLVVIPQALRVIVPPLTSQYLNITKNSSLAIAIGYMDVTATIGGISLNQTGREMECMTIVMGIYLFFSLLIAMFMNWYNSRIKLVTR